MSEVTLIGIDLGKHIFHLHAQDCGGHELWRKKVTRKQLLLLMCNFPRCTLVMEACAGVAVEERGSCDPGSTFVRPLHFFARHSGACIVPMRNKLPVGRCVRSSKQLIKITKVIEIPVPGRFKLTGMLLAH